MADLLDVAVGDGDPLITALRDRLGAWMLASTTVPIYTGIDGDDLTDLLTWVVADPHDHTESLPGADPLRLGTAALHAFEHHVALGIAIGWRDPEPLRGLLGG